MGWYASRSNSSAGNTTAPRTVERLKVRNVGWRCAHRGAKHCPAAIPARVGSPGGEGRQRCRVARRNAEASICVVAVAGLPRGEARRAAEVGWRCVEESLYRGNLTIARSPRRSGTRPVARPAFLRYVKLVPRPPPRESASPRAPPERRRAVIRSPPYIFQTFAWILMKLTVLEGCVVYTSLSELEENRPICCGDTNLSGVQCHECEINLVRGRFFPGEGSEPLYVHHLISSKRIDGS